MAQWKRIRLGTMRSWVRSLTSISGFGIRRGHELWCRLDPAWLWLWRRPAAVAPIRPLAWEPTYAMDVALKRKEKRNLCELSTTLTDEDMHQDKKKKIELLSLVEPCK